MARTIERRAAKTDIQIRETADGVTLRGYAAVFDSVWHDEVVRRGAFNKTLAERDDVRLLVNHDGVPLARSSSGTLTLGSDDRGLWVEARLDTTNPTAVELVSAMQRGDIDQMSFAFVDRTPREQRVDDEGIRNIREVQLFDVSVVTFPWYEDTTAELNSLALAGAEARSSGTKMTREERKKIAGLFPHINRRSLNGWTFADLWPLLWDAAEDSLADDVAYWWLYICDISDTWFVYCLETMDECICYQVDYTVTAEGLVTLGDPVNVVAKTTYIADPDQDDGTESGGTMMEAASSWRLEAAKFEAQTFTAA